MDDKIKVLYIDHSSVESPEELKKYLPNHYFDVRVLAPQKWHRPITWQQQNFIQRKVAFPGVRHRNFFLHAGDVIRDFQPHIIHVIEEVDTMFTWQACRLKDKYAPNAILLFDNFQNVLFEKIPRRFSFIYHFFEKYNISSAAAATVRNDQSENYLRHRGFKKPVYQIHWPVDTDLFKPSDKKGERDNFVIGYVGRIVKEKGIEMLLPVLAAFPECRLKIAGKGDYLEIFMSAADRLNVSGQISIVGFVPPQSLPDFYNDLDVLVLPSQSTPTWKEQFGRVLIEAMSCGVPAIGSSSGAIPLVIGDGGLVFDENSIEELKQQIGKCMNDRAFVKKLGQTARRRIENEYSLQHYQKRCFEIYSQLLKKAAK